MDYKVIERANKKYVEIKQEISSERDVLDIIGICISEDVNLLVLRETAITDAFINLKTGLAGMVLQKLMNYQIKSAVVISEESALSERFKELKYELNKAGNFRMFENDSDSEEWISDNWKGC